DSVYQMHQLNNFVTKFNQGLSVMAPIIEASGMDETAGIQRLLRDMSVNLEAGKTGGVFAGINTLIDRAIGSGRANQEANERAVQERMNASNQPAPEGALINGEVPGIPELNEVRL